MRRRLLAMLMVVLAFIPTGPVAPANAGTLSLPIPELIYRAQHGNAAAQYELGQRYRLGRGLPQSDPTALQWYLNSLDQGFPPAEDHIAMMYMNGRGGLPKDEAHAVRLYEKAASQGDFAAKIVLRVYRSGVVQWMRALPSTIRNMILLMVLTLFLVATMAIFLLCVFGLRRKVHRSKGYAAPQ